MRIFLLYLLVGLVWAGLTMRKSSFKTNLSDVTFVLVFAIFWPVVLFILIFKEEE